MLENVKTGMHTRLKQNVFDAMLHTPRYRRSEAQCTEDARGWLDFVGFRADDELLVTQLPYGEQRRVEIARALATQPKLLLLDEPAAGLNHNEKQELMELIRKIRNLGVGIVLIEHDMGLVMEISEPVSYTHLDVYKRQRGSRCATTKTSARRWASTDTRPS